MGFGARLKFFSDRPARSADSPRAGRRRQSNGDTILRRSFEVNGAQGRGTALAQRREDLVEPGELGRPVAATEQDLAAPLVEDERVAGTRVDVHLGERGTGGRGG